MRIIISGSLAFDRIMDFPGSFSDHILPDKIHILNVAFMINELKENFGGTAGNIAFTLALLDEVPEIVATSGRDFVPYKNWLERHKIPLNHITVIEDELTAGAYITTDKKDNQITAFNPGAMKYQAKFDFDSLESNTLGIVSPGNLDDMFQFPQKFKDKKIPYIFDPGQSLPAWDGNKLKQCIDGSKILICNDYEIELTQEKTSLNIEGLCNIAETVIVTRGDEGSEIYSNQNGSLNKKSIPVVKADKVVDPTGAGDSFRAGLIKGLKMNFDIEKACKVGAVASSFLVEAYGPQNLHFTLDSFNKRFQDAFGETL